MAVFLIDRILYRMWLKSSTHSATLTILEDEETLLLSSNWEISQNSILKPKNMKSGWQPNEHIFISAPALSRKYAIQSHPFTIFSAAPTVTLNGTRTHAWFSLLIRPQSSPGFTHSLVQHARTNSTTRIRLDGPYGSSHALDMLSSSHTAIIIAGGSGVAVAYPLLYSLLCPVGDPESPAKKPRVKFLWITHSPTHRLWIPEDKLKELEEWGLDLLIPPPTSLAGRPNVKNVLEEWTQKTDKVHGRTGVVVSGPDGLVRDVRNCVAGLVWQSADVDVQVEKFGW